MNILQDVIKSLNKEESRFFKLYAGRTNSSGERKDLQLFDTYKRLNKPNQDKLAETFYGKNKNAFYRLKNRLLSDINKSLLLQHLNNEEDLSILQFILLARIFKQKQRAQIAVNYLKKGEKKALQIEAFELLNIVYNELIKLSHDMISIDVEDYIQKRKQNYINLQQLHEIDDVLAAVMYRVRSAQNFSGKNAPILEVLQRTVQDFTENTQTVKSSKLRIKIYQAVSRILLQKHDFVALEQYLLHTLEEFSKDNLFSKQTHEIKLQMLTYLTNSLFKNGKLDLSLKYSRELKEAMNEYNGFLHDKFLFYYYNSQVLYYSQTDKEKTLEILEEAKKNSHIKQLPTYTVFIYLNTALVLFDLKRYKAAIKHLSRLCLHEDFLKIGRSFQIKIMMSELIIRYELGDFDYLEQRIKSVQKEFVDLLKKPEFTREVLLIDILSSLIYHSSIKNTPALLEKTEKLLSLMSAKEADDADVINYNHWLESKL